VIQPRVLDQIHEGARGPSPGIGCPVYHFVKPGQHDGSGTLRARL